MTKLLLPFFAVLVLTLSAPLLHADPASIQGYSPVAYFTENKPVKGSPDYASEHDGRTYYFQNAEEVAIFEADPAKYAPRFQICAYSLSTGAKREIDPTNFKVVGGSLLLFHRSDNADGLFAFENSGLSDEQLIERADAQYKLLEF